MSWAAEFGKLPITLKGIITSIVVCIPFFYVSLYLFHRNFFEKHDYYLILAFAFCFSILWNVCVVFITMGQMLLDNLDKKASTRTNALNKYNSDLSEGINEPEIKLLPEKIDKLSENVGTLTGGFSVSVIFLSLIIILSYYFKWNLKGFFAAIAVYVGVRFLEFIIVMVLKVRRISHLNKRLGLPEYEPGSES